MSTLTEYLAQNPQSEAIDETWKYVAPVVTGLSGMGLNPIKIFSKQKIGLRNVNDGVKRQFLNREQAENYYNMLLPYALGQNKTKDVIDFDSLSQQGKKDLRSQWKQFAKNNFIGKRVDISDYPTSTFSSNNIGKEYLHNLPNNVELPENLSDSHYHFSTNFKEEADRLYDHLIDNNPNGLYDYLMEVIKDKNGNISHTYKMMKNITRGDKP